jgi:PAS domain S-box-containing protein
LGPIQERPIRPELSYAIRPIEISWRERWLYRLSVLATFGVLVLSVLPLVGWALDNEWFKRFYHDFEGHSYRSVTNPLTAIGLIAAAGAVILLGRSGFKYRAARIVGVALCVGLVALGLVKLIDYFRLIPWPIDLASTRIFPRPSREDPEVGMSPNAALGLIFAGCSAVALCRARPRATVAGQLLGLGIFLLALLAIVGHAFRAQEIYTLPGTHPMSLSAALGFALFATGLLFSRPAEGVMSVLSREGPGGQLARRLIPACLLLPTMIGGLLMALDRAGILSSVSGPLSVLGTTVVLLTLVWTQANHVDQVEQRRHSAQQALRRSELFFHTLVETLPQNILIKNAEGHFTFVNRRFSQTVGRPQAELLGKTDADLFPRNLADKYRSDDRRVMSKGVTLETVEEHVTPDGQHHYVHVIKTPILDSGGRAIGVQAIFWDVTAERLAEARLRDQNAQLQEMAASERRAHEQLKRAQAQMVQNAKLAGLGQMVAGVAHEINNPLAFVINNLVVLQRDLNEVFQVLRAYREADPILRTHAAERAEVLQAHWTEADIDYALENLPGLISRTREGLARIQRIVKDLRVFARVDEERLVETDLNEGIATTVHIVEGTARARDVSIELELQPMRPVVCQAPKINQVVMNLVSNAIEACPPGGRIWIRSRDGDGQVTIEIEDTGCGIAPHVVDRIFDPFFTTKPVGEGTGLGLSISYGILKEHQGDIEVDSEPGRGTRFMIRLPRNLEPRVSSAQHAGSAPADPVPTASAASSLESPL